VRIYSTCTACNTLLQVSELGQQLHDSCHSTFPTGEPLVDAYLAAVDAEDDAAVAQLGGAIDAEDARVRPLLPAAVAYAEWGWPVFPLQPAAKIPYDRSRGFKDATTDVDVIRKWWTRAPESNIGIATGHVFDVLDVDFVTKDTQQATGAHTSWPDLRDSGRLPDVHGLATTPRGGIHVLLEPSGGGNKAGFLPGLDYRGIGGYIVAAPSRAPGGRRYTWWHRPSPMLTGTALEAETTA
jgi:hypothetical protein